MGGCSGLLGKIRGKMSRYKPVGWRNESHRHYLAAKGIKTRYQAHKYYYTPTYVAGDLPLIAGDAVGTAGAEAVSLIPVVVPLVLLYGGVKIAKKHKDKTGHWYLAEKEESDAEFATRTGFQPYNPLNPVIPVRPVSFNDLSLEDKERYVDMEEASVKDAEIFVRNLERMHQTRPEFVREHYGPLAAEFEKADAEQAARSKEAFRKAIPNLEPEVHSSTEEQLAAEPPISPEYGKAARELNYLLAEQDLRKELR